MPRRVGGKECAKLPRVSPPDNSPEKQPTWKDLAEFTSKQAENDRKVIEFWFKLAAGLLGLVITFAVAVIGFVGVKTISDARAEAQSSAQEAAKAKVKEILQDDRIQQLVRDTAKELLAKGTFRQTTEETVRAQLPGAIQAELTRQLPGPITAELEKRDLLPRTVSAKSEKAFEPRLRRYAGKKALILFLPEPEPKAFAASLENSLNRVGLSATKQEWAPAINMIIGEDEGFDTALSDLIGEAAGRKPTALTVANNVRATVARQSANSGSFQGFPDADIYIEIGVRQAKREN